MRMIPPAWLLIGLVVIGVIGRYVPDARVIGVPWTYSGLGLVLIGVGIVLYCALEFRVHKTTIHPGHTPTALMTGGIYKRSRNPIYLAMALVLVGYGVFVGNAVALVVPIVFLVILTRLFIVREEAVLRREFGEEYERYCEQTRRWV